MLPEEITTEHIGQALAFVFATGLAVVFAPLLTRLIGV